MAFPLTELFEKFPFVSVKPERERMVGRIERMIKIQKALKELIKTRERRMNESKSSRLD